MTAVHKNCCYTSPPSLNEELNNKVQFFRDNKENKNQEISSQKQQSFFNSVNIPSNKEQCFCFQYFSVFLELSGHKMNGTEQGNKVEVPGQLGELVELQEHLPA